MLPQYHSIPSKQLQQIQPIMMTQYRALFYLVVLRIGGDAFLSTSDQYRRRSVLATLGVRKEDGGDPAVVELLSMDDHEDDDEDWIPDRVKAQARQKEARRIYAEKVASETEANTSNANDYYPTTNKPRPSPYTEEEEEIISAMGGKTFHSSRKREIGFLGDSTLSEIATDYSVPICYVADVLCMWGVPVPIDPSDRLGDLVTGEQAFALLEAVNSLDVAALHDRYSNTNLMQFCHEFDIPLQSAFEMAMKEGWSLPFGVQTCLRVEQEDELLRVFGQPFGDDSTVDAIDID